MAPAAITESPIAVTCRPSAVCRSRADDGPDGGWDACARMAALTRSPALICLSRPDSPVAGWTTPHPAAQTTVRAAAALTTGHATRSIASSIGPPAPSTVFRHLHVSANTGATGRPGTWPKMGRWLDRRSLVGLNKHTLTGRMPGSPPRWDKLWRKLDCLGRARGAAQACCLWPARVRPIGCDCSSRRCAVYPRQVFAAIGGRTRSVIAGQEIDIGQPPAPGTGAGAGRDSRTRAAAAAAAGALGAEGGTSDLAGHRRERG